MGYALARQAMLRGAKVTLVSGPVALKAPLFVEKISVTSAAQMFEAVTGLASEQDIIIKAAAVADYTPVSAAQEKIKKSEGESSILLTRTEDILGWLGQHRREGQFLCGFSMETENMLENSRQKLKKKKVDMIVANNLKTAGAGFGVDTNVVTLITPESAEELPQLSKDEVAEKILDRIMSTD
jgi:phosphopantothenoylcysteine decarboxylase/phosphopantothenate--cysteine ligase